MKPPNVKCLSCDKECYIPKYRIPSFKYCSRVCKDKHCTVLIKANCLICEKEFEHISSRCNKAKYCSRKCYHKAQSKKGRTDYTCFHCGKEFRGPKSHRRKYCSKQCVGKAERSLWHPNFTTVRKKMVRESMIKKCAICGYNEFPDILGVHHIDQNRKNNTKINLLVLCPMCHSLIHHKHICH